jgi:transposase InsO family protein
VTNANATMKPRVSASGRRRQGGANHQPLSMDFVHDQLIDAGSFRVLTVIDEWSREDGILEPRFCFRGKDVTELRERRVTLYGIPETITDGHGREFTSKAPEAWARMRDVKLDFIHPVNEMRNGHIASSNGRLRDQCLNVISSSHSIAPDNSSRHGVSTTTTVDSMDPWAIVRPQNLCGDTMKTDFRRQRRFSRSELSFNG